MMNWEPRLTPRIGRLLVRVPSVEGIHATEKLAYAVMVKIRDLMVSSKKSGADWSFKVLFHHPIIETSLNKVVSRWEEGEKERE